MTPDWIALHPRVTLEYLGLLPHMLDNEDPRPAKEQFHANYQHGGGWRTIAGFKLTSDHCLLYPGDPPIHPMAMTKLRDEIIVLCEASLVVIIQPDGSFEASRMD